ncbi:nedd4-binding protein 2-like 2 [Limosa lapponica baueri]|uniref:Nedd4-binding protein 2-like 2 n=1 Tax=Limosa lapponica baueri TaxID=1758121 RepID=A0A2I0TZ21_LIMLA|nr:nedd4-binding protein 2-like 2 [Limosa lapponica baueri]
MKCLYTTGCNTGHKQEATMLLESYDIVTITETWWDESYDWSVAIEGYKLFRRDRQGRSGRAVALYVKEWIECKMSLKNSQEEVESLWVGIRDRGNKGNLLVGVYYRLPYEGQPIDEAFLLQLQEASHSKALVLLGDFNHPNICWKSNTTSCRQSMRFLECLNNNFLRQEINSPTQGDAILDLIVTKASELIRDVKIGGSLSCSDHALVEFTVLRHTCQSRSMVRTLNFRKANLQLFKELVNRSPWEMVLRDKRTERRWEIFKDSFHRPQDLSIPRCNKSSKKEKRPARLSRDLLVKLKGKKELHRQFKQDQASWEEYRGVTQLYRDHVRKAKAQLELNLARDVKSNKKGFCRYVSQRRKVKESVPSLISKNGKPVTTVKEKAEVLNNFLPQSSMPTPLLKPPELKDQEKTGYESEEQH